MRVLTSIVFLLVLPAMTAVAAPDIEVQKSTNSEFPVVNEPVEFIVRVSNIGDAPGRALVRFYYRYSPPIAGYIADRSSLRTIVRVLVAPIVFTIENPGLAALILFGFIGGIWRWRRYLLQATPE